MAEDSLKLFRVLSSSSQAQSIGPSSTAGGEEDDAQKRNVLVLAAAGRVPAPDVLQEVLPVLRVRGDAGVMLGATDELLRVKVTRPPQAAPPDDVPPPPPSNRPQRAGRRRPAPIDTFQKGLRTSVSARSMASHVPPLTSPNRDLDGMMGDSSPCGWLDIVWREVEVTLEECGSLPQRFTIECRSSVDNTLLWTSSPLDPTDFVSANLAPQAREVILCTPAGSHDDSNAEALREEMSDIFLRNVAGTIEVRGVWLSRSEADRRSAAWAMSKDRKLFEEYVDEQDAAGDTALIRATRGKRLMAARTLLAAGADACLCNHAGASAYQIACQETPALLPWLRASFAGGYDPLLVAASEGRLPQVQQILQGQASVAIDTCNHAGDTALMLASVHGHLEVMRCLLAAGACVDQRCEQGYTPLMRVSGLGRGDAVRFLLENKAAADMVRDDGSTALMDCAGAGHTGVVKILVAFSAQINARRRDGSTALAVAVQSGPLCTETIHVLLLAGADPNVTYESSHCTIPYVRSEKSRVDACSFRLPLGQGENGVTPLMCAAWNGFHHPAQLLITHKADLDAQSASGYTAIQGATGNMHVALVALLLSHKADLGLSDHDGNCALDECARLDDHTVLHDMLLEAANVPDLTINSRRKYAAHRQQMRTESARSHRRRSLQSRSTSVQSSRATSQNASPAMTPRYHA
jgi:ankyrin repeat protein